MNPVTFHSLQLQLLGLTGDCPVFFCHLLFVLLVVVEEYGGRSSHLGYTFCALA